MSETTTELREIVRSTNCLLSEIDGELRVLRSEMRGEIKSLKTEAQSDIRMLWLGLLVVGIGMMLLVAANFGLHL